MANFFKEYRERYLEKNKGKEVEDLTSKINGREGTETPAPASIKSEKILTKKQKARLSEINEQ